MSNAGANKRKTSIKTFRLSESLTRSLKKEAADESTTVNALANAILNDHFDFARKLREFGIISLSKPLFMSIIEELDDETLARMGREVLAASWKEMAEFFFQDSSPDKILEAVSLRSKVNPGHLRTRITKEEGTYTIVCHHDFGPKLTIILKNALQEVARKSFLVEPRISAGESVVTVSFKVNPLGLSVSSLKETP